jgi:hypothetical protein
MAGGLSIVKVSKLAVLCVLILPPLSPSTVRHRVLGQDASRVGGASTTELANGERAGADPLQCVASREGYSSHLLTLLSSVHMPC